MIARALACAAIASALLMAVALEHARARAHELASDLGPTLLAYAGATRDEGPRTLLVNGAALRMRTGTTSDSIETLIERQRATCGPAHLTLPALSWRSADEGILGCLVVPEGASLFERLLRLDELRVTWVMASGDARRYLTIATQDPLSIARMFPAQGEAPGSDAPRIPRPPGATRILSAAQRGAEPMLVAYRSDRSLEALEREYRSLLEARGHIVQRGPSSEGPSLLVRAAGSAQLVLLGRDGERALAVILPLPTQPPG